MINVNLLFFFLSEIPEWEAGTQKTSNAIIYKVGGFDFLIQGFIRLFRNNAVSYFRAEKKQDSAQSISHWLNQEKCNQIMPD